jgi:hypothetical protein
MRCPLADFCRAQGIKRRRPHYEKVYHRYGTTADANSANINDGDLLSTHAQVRLTDCVLLATLSGHFARKNAIC